MYVLLNADPTESAYVAHDENVCVLECICNVYRTQEPTRTYIIYDMRILKHKYQQFILDYLQTHDTTDLTKQLIHTMLTRQPKDILDVFVEICKHQYTNS